MVGTIQMSHFNIEEHDILGLSSRFLTLRRGRTYRTWRPRFSINEDGASELEAEQTVVNQVCLLTGSILNILTSIRDSVMKMVKPIRSQKRTSIFVFKILPQK